MLTIGDIARRAGVSRRQLRHWEHQGLLRPASTDPATGYRWYDESQVGRVRAISELRDLGFSLQEVSALLDPALARIDLDAVLRRQEVSLRHQISVATSRLSKIEGRLAAIKRQSEEIAMHLTLEPLPALVLWGYTTEVSDEADISTAVAHLQGLLPRDEGVSVMLFDGSQVGHITVSVGLCDRHGGDAQHIVTEAVPRGVSVRFDSPPVNVADAWVVISDELEKSALRTAGIYRQILNRDDSVLLQAPVINRAGL